MKRKTCIFSSTLDKCIPMNLNKCKYKCAQFWNWANVSSFSFKPVSVNISELITFHIHWFYDQTYMRIPNLAWKVDGSFHFAFSGVRSHNSRQYGSVILKILRTHNISINFLWEPEPTEIYENWFKLFNSTLFSLCL